MLTKCFKADGQLFYGEVRARSSADADGEDGDGGEDVAAKPTDGFARHGLGTSFYMKKTLGGKEVVVKKHVGTWDNDVMTGNGKVEYYDGSKYEGNLVNGAFHGEGTFTSLL